MAIHKLLKHCYLGKAVCVCVCMGFIRVRSFGCVYVCDCRFLCVFAYMFSCVRVCMCVHLCVLVCVSICRFDSHVCVCVCSSVCSSVCVYSSVCVCVLPQRWACHHGGGRRVRSDPKRHHDGPALRGRHLPGGRRRRRGELRKTLELILSCVDV